MLKPENKTRIVWEIFILLVTIYVFIKIPLSVVFSGSTESEILLFEVIISFIYFIDIVIRLNTAVVYRMDLITDRHKVASIYLKGWFWIDLAQLFLSGYCCVYFL